MDACTDELYAQRRQWFDLSHHPLIYTPGDNEWTDCRRSLSDKRDPLERMQKLRVTFSSGADSLGQRPVRLERQSKDFPEHARWEHEGMVFITLNAPGPDNNARMKDEYVRREKAQREWIAQAFDAARRHGARRRGLHAWRSLERPGKAAAGIFRAARYADVGHACV